MELTAPAKINLYLKILGRREDGYHDIFTVFERISLCDSLTVDKKVSSSVIKCDDPRIDTSTQSLLGRTVTLFKKEAGYDGGFRVDVRKRIPVGAGLGGGSSDAAALLKAMNEFAGKPLSAGRLADVALELGSDVPFFLAESSFALAGGRGEVLLPVDSPLRFTHILINPGYSLSTADIYRRTGVLNLTKKQGIDRMMSTFLEEGNAAGIVENLHNDLQTIVLEDLKDLKSIFRVLAGAGASGVLMSGSGPTVFGLFDKEDLESAAERIKGMEDFDPRWRVIPARTF